MAGVDESVRELTELQLKILDVLWQRGEATVSQVHGALAPELGLAPTTVSTILSRLEKRGVVNHRVEGRQFVYHPAVSRDRVCDSMVSALTQRLFDGDVTALVSHLITAPQITPGDLARVRRLIAQHSRETEEDDRD